MASRQEREERERRQRECERLEEQLLQDRLSDEQVQRLDQVINEGDELRRNYEEVFKLQEERLTEVSQRVNEYLLPGGDIDIDKLRRRTNNINRQRLVASLTEFLGYEGDFNALRSLNPQWRDRLMRAEGDMLAESNENLRKENTTLREQKNRLGTTNTELRDQVSVLNTQVSGLNTQVSGLNTQVSQLRERNISLASSVKCWKALDMLHRAILRSKSGELENMEAIHLQKDENIKELTERVLLSEKLQKGCDELITRLQAEIAKAGREKKSLEESNVEIRNSLHRVEGIVESKTLLIDSLKNQINDKDTLIKDKDGQIEALRGANIDAQAEWFQAERCLKANVTELEEALSEAIDANAALQGEEERLSSELSAAKAAGDEASGRLTDAEEKITSLEGENSDISGKLADAEQKITSLEDENSKISDQLADAKRKITSLESGKSEISDKLVDAENKITSLEAANSQASGKLDDAHRAMSSLQDTNLAGDGIISMLEELVGFLASQSEDSVRENLEPWCAFSRAVQEAPRIQVVRPSDTAWTVIRPWGIDDVDEEDEGEATNLVGLLTRLYKTAMTGSPRCPLGLLRLLTQRLGTAESLPLDAVSMVFARLVDRFEEEEVRQKDFMLEMAAFALLQSAKLARRRSATTHAGMEVVETRAKTLLRRSSTAMALFAQILDEGEEKLAEHLASSGDEAAETPLSGKATYCPETGIGLAKVPESVPLLWLLSTGDKTIRAVHRRLGKFDGINKYRFTSTTEDGDVLLDLPHIKERRWVFRNAYRGSCSTIDG
ncbi:hypothetical protein F4805DRAFT_474177 [Annulohypoxylon moriforme]|nr:hypothetical protein F4805DRAFT_474177 [Annulohypoxylon moriforme]